MTKKSKPVDGQVSEEKIKQWKALHRKVYCITVDDEGDLIAGYFKRPDMATLSAVNALQKTDEVKAANSLFANCWLGGSDMVEQDAVVKMAMMAKFNDIMNLARGELKNL